MGRRGTKNTPSATRELRGDPGKRGVNRSEPRFGGAPEPPAWLTAEQLAFWRRIVPQLVAAGVATSPDAPALAGMCYWWAEWLTAKNRLTRVRNIKTVERQRLVGIVRTTWQEFSRIAMCFAMTPAARASLETDRGDRGGKLGAYLGGDEGSDAA